MNNPFEVLEARLSNIESLILDLKHKPKEVEHPKQDKLLTIDEAAELLHLSKPTLYSKVSRNELPFMKQGKRLYFSKSELMDYVKEGRVKTDAEIKQDAESFLNKKGGAK